MTSEGLYTTNKLEMKTTKQLYLKHKFQYFKFETEM